MAGNNRKKAGADGIKRFRKSMAARTSSEQVTPPRKKNYGKGLKQLAKIGVLLGIILLLFVLGMILGDPPKEEAVSDSIFSSAVSSAPISSAVSSKFEPPVVGPYDESDPPLLLRADRPVPEDYVLNLENVGSGFRLQKRAAEAFLAMKEAAAKDGISLWPLSAYRTHEKQLRNYNASIQNYLGQGFSKAQAEARTQQFYAIPGTSEHEAGLAIDLNSLYQSFENTKTYSWLIENCGQFGFILRYAKDTQPTTGIAYEPWHYRYVGTNHAKAIAELGLTLDEYVWMLEGEQEEGAFAGSSQVKPSAGSSSPDSSGEDN